MLPASPAVHLREPCASGVKPLLFLARQQRELIFIIHRIFTITTAEASCQTFKHCGTLRRASHLRQPCPKIHSSPSPSHSCSSLSCCPPCSAWVCPNARCASHRNQPMTDCPDRRSEAHKSAPLRSTGRSRIRVQSVMLFSITFTADTICIVSVLCI